MCSHYLQGIRLHCIRLRRQFYRWTMAEQTSLRACVVLECFDTDTSRLMTFTQPLRRVTTRTILRDR